MGEQVMTTDYRILFTSAVSVASGCLFLLIAVSWIAIEGWSGAGWLYLLGGVFGIWIIVLGVTVPLRLRDSGVRVMTTFGPRSFDWADVVGAEIRHRSALGRPTMVVKARNGRKAVPAVLVANGRKSHELIQRAVADIGERQKSSARPGLVKDVNSEE